MGNTASSGNEASTYDAGIPASQHNYYNENEEDYDDPFDGIDTLGYRVLGVQPNSPAASAGLVSFLDFLVGAENKMLLGSGEDLEPGQEYDDVDFPALLGENKGKSIELLVWNIKSQTARLVDIIPSDSWGGAGLLGVTIRLDNYAGAEDRLVRVLSIDSPKSPAAIAGLVPEKDFLLGTTHQTLDNVDRLAAILRQHEDEVVELYVYNTDEDVVRVIALLPTSNWEGSRGGLLGAEVGTGYLHRLPHTSRNTAGSSVERKVRYIEAEKPIDVSTQQGLERLNGSEKQNAGTHKVLELEPQLEMEPGEDEDLGGRRPHVSPSAVGMTSTKEEQPKQAAESVVPDPSPALQPTNANGVPVLIFTPTIQSSSGPPKAPLSGDGLGSHRSSLGNSKYPPSASIPTASPPARTSSSSSSNPPYPTASRYPLPTTHLQQPSPFYGPPPQQQPNPTAVFSQPPPPPPAVALLPNLQSNSQTPPVCGSFPSASTPNAPQQFGFLPPPPKPHVSAQLFAGTQSSNSPTPPLIYPYEQQHQQSDAPNGDHLYSAPQHNNEPHESQLQGADSYQRGRSV